MGMPSFDLGLSQARPGDEWAPMVDVAKEVASFRGDVDVGVVGDQSSIGGSDRLGRISLQRVCVVLTCLVSIIFLMVLMF